MSKLNQIKIPINLVSEEPDGWVIIKLPDLDGGEPLYKVFASWAGGYLGGDRYRLNSGIVKVEQDDTYFYFFGYSGSCYKCHKKGYGVITTYGQSVLVGMIEQAKSHSIDVQVIDKDNDWVKLINK